LRQWGGVWKLSGVLLRRLLSLGCILALAGATSAAAPATRPARSAVVTKVLAGDTLLVRLETGKRLRVHVLGVRAPTRGSCFASDSRDQAEVLAGGRRVRLLGAGGAAYVALPGGADLGRLLVSQGYAEIDAWGPSFSRLVSYVPAQQAAQAATRGMWGACAADVAVALAADPGAVAPNGRLTYTATVTNQGPLGARDLTLDLRPPRSLELLSAASGDGACTASGWVAVCSFRALADGGTATATFVVQAGAAGTIATRAHVRFAGCAVVACASKPLQDSVPDNNETASLVPVGTPATGGGGPDAGCDTYHYASVCIP
jgi:endonuclease YncB( thermonuclease family)